MKQIRIISMGMALLTALPLFSQTEELSRKEKRQLQKELRKEQKAEEARAKAAVVNAMVERQAFVLEADRLRDRRGNTINVSPVINFIAVDSTHGVIQIGSNQYIGGNGVGGVTVEGPVSNYEKTLDERSGTYSVTYMVRTTTGTYDVRMTVFGEGRAEATVSSNWPGRLTYSGFLVPPSLSKVYKGISY